MRIISLISLAAAASLVSAGKFLSEMFSSVVQGAYIIEYEDGVDHAKANNFLNSYKVDYKVRGEFSVFNGAPFNVKSGHSGEDLAKIPGIKRVWPVEIISIGQPKVTKNKPPNTEQLYGPHNMTGVDYVHKTLKTRARASRRASSILVSITPTLPSVAVSVTDGTVSAMVENPTQKSDLRDHCHGHGTHIAGVPIPAKSVLHPLRWCCSEVIFGAYRVLDCNGSGSNEGIMCGMELAFNQGLHVINMSLGGGADYKTNHIATLADKLTAHCMAVVAAAGNDGDDDIGMLSNAGLGDLSTSNKAIYLPLSTTLFPLLQQDGSLQDGCDATSYTVAVKGKVVLIIGDFNRWLLVPPAYLSSRFRLTGMVGFPMASIGYMAAEDVKAGFKKNPANKFSWPSGEKNFKRLRIKPDISTPGGNIYSTFPVHMGSHAIESGTLMATPYTAGAHALLFSARKKILLGQDARRILKSTAVRGCGFMEVHLTSVVKQGAGLINLLDTVHFAGKSVEVKIKNLGKKTTTYTLSHEASSVEVSYDAANTWPLPMPANKVTVKAGQTAKVKVQFSQPATGKPEQLHHRPPSGKDPVSVRIPYAGVKGDIAEVPIVDSVLGYLTRLSAPPGGPFGRNGNRDNDGKLEMYVYKWVGDRCSYTRALPRPVTPAPGGAYKVLAQVE
ncbi:hypothetical protein BG000_011155 [Podila horticola]|nr:hypothetical protein BG000_011155 [Podila horticola]